MTEQKNKPTNAAQKLLELEKDIQEIKKILLKMVNWSQTIDPALQSVENRFGVAGTEIDNLYNNIKMLELRSLAIISAAALDKIKVAQEEKKLLMDSKKAEIAKLVEQGFIKPSEDIIQESDMVVSRIEGMDGTVVDSRLQFVVSEMKEGLKSLIVGQKVGSAIPLVKSIVESDVVVENTDDQASARLIIEEVYSIQTQEKTFEGTNEQSDVEHQG